MSDVPNLWRVELVKAAIEKYKRCPHVSLIKGDQGAIGGKGYILGMGGLTETSSAARLKKSGIV